MTLDKVFLIVVIVSLLTDCTTKKSKLKEVKSVRIDTWYSANKNDRSYTVNKYDSNDNIMVSLEYDHDNKLIKSRNDFKWGWYSTIYTDSFAEINEIWYADSSKGRNDIVLNREYAIKLNGDTVCKTSCFYKIIGLSKNKDSIQNHEYSITIPCHGFSENAEISYEASIKVTNHINFFNLYELSTSLNTLKFNLGMMEIGKYYLYGKIYIYNKSKNLLQYRELFIDDVINIE